MIKNNKSQVNNAKPRYKGLCSFCNINRMVSMLLILSLIVCTCMILVYKDSFSWLSYNKNANVGNMGMSVDFDDADAVYNIYKWDIDMQALTCEDFTYDDSAVTLHMNKYDTVFEGINLYTPVIIRIALTGTKIPQSGSLTFTINRTTARDSQLFYFSDFVNFKSGFNASYYTSYQTLSDSNSGYNWFRGIIDSNGFTNTSEFSYFPDNQSVNTLNLTARYDANDWNGNTLNLYLIIEYDETRIVDEIGSNLELNDDWSNTNELNSDITFVRIRYGQ